MRTFVRLSGCNLQCVWCDTPYTWNWEGTPWPHVRDLPGAPYKFVREVEMVRMTVEKVANAIAALPSEGVVITGGEPLLQARGVVALIAQLRAQTPAVVIEIETNGTIAPEAELVGMVDLFMVSPKLAHAGNDNHVAIRPEVIQALVAVETAAFKFVARASRDVGEVAGFAERFGIAPGRVFIMPEGTDSATVTRVGASLIDAIMAAGFNYSDRLHMHLFGDARAT